MAAELGAGPRSRSRDLVRDLVICARAQRIGALLRALQVTPDQMTSVYWRLQSDIAEISVPIGAAAGAEDYGDLGDLLGEFTASASARGARSVRAAG